MSGSSPSSWNRLASIWQSAAEAVEPNTLIGRTRQAGRAARRMDVAAAALAALGVLGIVAAIYHAANAVEHILGAVAIAGLVASWIIHVRGDRATRRSAAAPSDSFIRERSEIRRRQIRFARFTWSTVTCALVFLGPWWLGGVRAHGLGLTSLMVAGFWVPLAGILVCVVWTVRVARTARHELRALEHIAEAGRIGTRSAGTTER